jgi:hypothetical protein
MLILWGVEKVHFQKPKAFRLCIWDPRSYGDSDALNNSAQNNKGIFKSFDFDQWGVAEKHAFFVFFGLEKSKMAADSTADFFMDANHRGTLLRFIALETER